MVNIMENEHKADRRANKRHRQKFGQTGIGMSKVRTLSEPEKENILNRVNKIKKGEKSRRLKKRTSTKR